MGKKKRSQVFVLKPWCWYCEREFEDEKVLLQHQKSKHFKCQLCPRKLNTAGGLMVHSTQVHKCEPEPLTNTLPGRDGFDVEIFGMEGVPENAKHEWKARKEAEFGTAVTQAAAASNRPRISYNVIPEADLRVALAQHKALMARRHDPAPPFLPPFPPPAMNGIDMPLPNFPPPGFPIGMPPPGLPPGMAPQFPNGQPPFPPPFPPPTGSPFPPNNGTPVGAAGVGSPFAAPPVRPPPNFLPASSEASSVSQIAPNPLGQVQEAVEVLPPKDGIMWPDATASPAEKRALQPRYRYISPTPDESARGETEVQAGGRKRKAAADFI